MEVITTVLVVLVLAGGLLWLAGWVVRQLGYVAVLTGEALMWLGEGLWPWPLHLARLCVGLWARVTDLRRGELMPFWKFGGWKRW